MQKKYHRVMRAAVLLAGVLMMAVLPGCATPIIWPVRDATVSYWFSPSFSMKQDNAIGTLKNLQGRTFTMEDKAINHLDVDVYGYRGRAVYTETSSGTRKVNTSSGGFIGTDYVTTYGQVDQPWERQEQKEDLLIIPFNRVKSMSVHYLASVERWMLLVILEGDAPGHAVLGETRVVAVFKDGTATRDFAEAVASMAKAQGWDGGVSLRGRIGIEIDTLTPAQIMDIGRPDVQCGVLVTSVDLTGPADKAGIRAGDVLLMIDGVIVANDDQFSPLMKNPTVVIRGLRRGMVPNKNGRLVPGWVEQTFNVTRWGM